MGAMIRRHSKMFTYSTIVRGKFIWVTNWIWTRKALVCIEFVTCPRRKILWHWILRNFGKIRLPISSLYWSLFWAWGTFTYHTDCLTTCILLSCYLHLWVCRIECPYYLLLWNECLFMNHIHTYNHDSYISHVPRTSSWAYMVWHIPLSSEYLTVTHGFSWSLPQISGLNEDSTRTGSGLDVESPAKLTIFQSTSSPPWVHL